MSEIIKIIDERERQKKRKDRKTERHKGVAQVTVKVWEINGFVARLS